MNFYTKVLAKFASAAGLKLKVTVEVAPDAGVSDQKAPRDQNPPSANWELNDDLHRQVGSAINNGMSATNDETRDVIFLGAGASSCANFPINED